MNTEESKTENSTRNTDEKRPGDRYDPGSKDEKKEEEIQWKTTLERGAE